MTSTCLVALVGIGGCARDLDDAVRREIRTRVASTRAPSHADAAPWRLLRQVYRDNEERPLWSRAGRPLARARELVSSTCRAGREGLRPGEYELEGLRDAVKALEEKERPGRADLAALDSGSRR
jgi:hypothetical protein